MKKIINPWRGLEGYNCFGCAPHNEYGVKMTFYEEGDEVISLWKPDGHYQGFLHTLHGGIQSVLLDEICGWVVFRKLQTAGMTSKMETRFRKAVSTGSRYLLLRASLREQKRNLAFVEARLYDDRGVLCTEALCTYFMFPKEKAEKEMYFRSCEVEPQDVSFDALLAAQG